MAVPTAITDLSTTASSNSPQGSESPSSSNGPDDFIRALSSFIALMNQAPKFRAYVPTSNQSVSSGVATKVSLTAETFDIGSCFDTTNKKWTPNVAGYYSVHLHINMTCTGDTMSQAYASIFKNGSECARGGQFGQSTGRSGHSAMVTTLVYMNGSTDYLEFYGYETATSPAFYAGTELTYACGNLVAVA